MAETRYISPKTGWKAELLQAAGGQRGLSTNRCTPQRAGLCKVTKQIDQPIEGLTVQRERANRGQTSGNQRKGVIDRKLTKDDKHDIILKKMYQ